MNEKYGLLTIKKIIFVSFSKRVYYVLACYFKEISIKNVLRYYHPPSPYESKLRWGVIVDGVLIPRSCALHSFIKYLNEASKWSSKWDKVLTCIKLNQLTHVLLFHRDFLVDFQSTRHRFRKTIHRC